MIACWCQREETPDTPLSPVEKDQLQFLYDEWAHPYFISNLEFGRLMEASLPQDMRRTARPVLCFMRLCCACPGVLWRPLAAPESLSLCECHYRLTCVSSHFCYIMSLKGMVHLVTQLLPMSEVVCNARDCCIVRYLQCWICYAMLAVVFASNAPDYDSHMLTDMIIAMHRAPANYSL